MTGPWCMDRALEPTTDPAWVLDATGYDPLRETSVESRFAVSNGFLGVRAARVVTRGTRWITPPRTYVAGLYDAPGTEPSVPALIPAANWLHVNILLPDGPLVHHPGDVLSYCTTLDMRRGGLLAEGRRLTSPDLVIRVRLLRFVSLSERALGQQLVQLNIENGTVEITLEASFEGTQLGLREDRLEQDIGRWRTQNSGKRLAMAAASSPWIDGQPLAPATPGPLKWSWTWQSRPGQVVCFERSVAVVRSDSVDTDPGGPARHKLAAARHLGWHGVLAEHEAAWAERWRCSGVEVAGDPAAQQALRFALYHLNSAANPADEHVSIGARALTGEDYHGHVFWDTEIFLLPFYIFTWPEAARALLMYRFHTLDAARAKAARMGWRGAFYAWESADTGAETTPEQVIGPDRRVVDILCGTQEQHISADVAYAVWQYWRASGDETFLRDAGAEILLETGRFWASRAQPEADGHCHIRGVIGPDEYHEHIDDNAFTNVMARWNIRRALDVAAWYRQRWPAQWERLAGRLGLVDAELQQWRDVAQTIATGFDGGSGLFEQFAGYFALEQIDLTTYAGRSVPMDVVLGRERTQRSQVIKQADVVALLALLPEEFAGETAAANFRYYEPRCGHGSSLSPALHGLAAARLGWPELALGYFRRTAAIDLSDTHVAIDGGIHIAALGGIWMLAVFGFAGLSLRADGLGLDPHLPASWHSLAFAVQWRGRRLKVLIDQDRQLVEATLEAGEPMAITVRGEQHAIHPHQALRVSTERP